MDGDLGVVGAGGIFRQLPGHNSSAREPDAFLRFAGLKSDYDDPVVAERTREHKLRAEERARKHKLAVERSWAKFAEEYRRLAELDVKDHRCMHDNVEEDLENLGYPDPKCVDERSDEETDTDRGISKTRIANNCMCRNCRPEMYSEERHAEWKSELEAKRAAERERAATEERERAERAAKKLRRERAAQCTAGPVVIAAAPGGRVTSASAARSVVVVVDPVYTTVHQPDPASTWYKGKAAELAAKKAKMFEGL